MLTIYDLIEYLQGLTDDEKSEVIREGVIRTQNDNYYLAPDPILKISRSIHD